MLMAVINDIQEDLKIQNEQLKSGQSLVESEKKLFEIIQLQSDAKQLRTVVDFNNF